MARETEPVGADGAKIELGPEVRTQESRMRLALLLALVIAATAMSGSAAVPVAPIERAEDVLGLVRAGIKEPELVARIRGAGHVFELAPEQAVRLWMEGVPASAIGALFATQGEDAPRVTGRPTEIELLYPSFRIVGRRGAEGPVLAVSGYARDGTRLAPAVETPIEHRASYEEPAHAASWQPAELDPALTYASHGSSSGSAYVPLEPEPRASAPTGYVPQHWGAPDFVSVTQVPASSIQSGTVVLPVGAPAWSPYDGWGGGYGYGGYGGYGYGGGYGGGYVSYTLGPVQYGAGSHQGGYRGRGHSADVVHQRIRR